MFSLYFEKNPYNEKKADFMLEMKLLPLNVSEKSLLVGKINTIIDRQCDGKSKKSVLEII